VYIFRKGVRNITPEELIYRKRLMKASMDRGLSVQTMYRITAPMDGKTNEEKEHIAAQLLTQVEAGDYDTEERVDWDKFTT
jgi:hypothetical protein